MSNPLRIYIATRKQENAWPVRERLIAAGHICTSTWLDERDYVSMPKNEATRYGIATRDLVEIASSDALVLISEPDGAYVPGGKHVEFGFALALGLRIFVLGVPENVFHWHLAVVRCESPEELVSVLGGAV